MHLLSNAVHSNKRTLVFSVLQLCMPAILWAEQVYFPFLIHYLHFLIAESLSLLSEESNLKSDKLLP